MIDDNANPEMDREQELARFRLLDRKRKNRYIDLYAILDGMNTGTTASIRDSTQSIVIRLDEIVGNAGNVGAHERGSINFVHLNGEIL